MRCRIGDWVSWVSAHSHMPERFSKSVWHVYIQLPHPNAEEPNHQFVFSGYLGFWQAPHYVLVLNIRLANGFMNLRPIIKQIMRRMRAGFCFWPRIILTATLCNPTELLTVNLIWFIQKFPYIEPPSLPIWIRIASERSIQLLQLRSRIALHLEFWWGWDHTDWYSHLHNNHYIYE